MEGVCASNFQSASHLLTNAAQQNRGGPAGPRRRYITVLGNVGQLKGEVHFDWHREGLTCEIALPLV